MRYIATHPDAADAVTVDTEDADSARAIAAAQFAETLNLPESVVHSGVQVQG